MAIFQCCNPLAGIQVFHTEWLRAAITVGVEGWSVVIPWRGFRCFTQERAYRPAP